MYIEYQTHILNIPLHKKTQDFQNRTLALVGSMVQLFLCIHAIYKYA